MYAIRSRLPIPPALDFDTVRICGKVRVSVDGANLTDVIVDMPTPSISAEIIPDGIVKAFAKLTQDQFPSAVESAAEEAAQQVFTRLIEDLKPSVGLAFEKPIVQSSRLDSVSVVRDQLMMKYGTRIEAENPLIAHESHAILERTMTSDIKTDGMQASARLFPHQSVCLRRLGCRQLRQTGFNDLISLSFSGSTGAMCPFSGVQYSTRMVTSRRPQVVVSCASGCESEFLLECERWLPHRVFHTNLREFHAQTAIADAVLGGWRRYSNLAENLGAIKPALLVPAC